MNDPDDIPPLVRKERRRGTTLAIILIALLLLVVLFFYGEEYLDRVPPEPTDIQVEVKPGAES